MANLGNPSRTFSILAGCNLRLYLQLCLYVYVYISALPSFPYHLYICQFGHAKHVSALTILNHTKPQPPSRDSRGLGSRPRPKVQRLDPVLKICPDATLRCWADLGEVVGFGETMNSIGSFKHAIPYVCLICLFLKTGYGLINGFHVTLRDAIGSKMHRER